MNAAAEQPEAELCGDDLASALACLRSWEPDVRMLGNVRVATLLALLERAEAEQAVLDATIAALGELSDNDLRDCSGVPEPQATLARAELARREAAK